MQAKEEKTYLMIKPDGVRKGLIGEIIRRLEQRDLKVVALQMVRPSREEIDQHYPKDETWIKRLGSKSMATYLKYNLDPIKEVGTSDELVIGQMVREWLVDYMTSAPVVKVVIQGIHAVEVVRKIVGQTIPSNAEMGTIRGDFSIDSPLLANQEKRAVMNLVHASETAEEALHEIKHWFGTETPICDYKRFGVDE
ncbi:MAG: nucleoside-diphosphate kinase [Candidatus Vogelbacteria bacterium CG22_combo_CG10-13_8_21_14_all_37_9]|uniref:nucleoside-diphosphate kinase n=1 Tax=Candidatus Vogelbacteria bacterium CG22_combo_CG10-13_8_21_14_all_37_9 TaxID=1975046 RepID=A0A2H0BKG7_9BACT|nr:MAG: nucleoside-diphosphate kinase [bacterium CG10_37_50]PIP58173.1 MAG: nucleoside-diphosphate kinase [Candidatus Vogelbacteria bacterium CG22_combo_CG10-13_8_21_14_all_37_9]